MGKHTDWYTHTHSCVKIVGWCRVVRAALMIFSPRLWERAWACHGISWYIQTLIPQSTNCTFALILFHVVAVVVGPMELWSHTKSLINICAFFRCAQGSWFIHIYMSSLFCPLYVHHWNGNCGQTLIFEQNCETFFFSLVFMFLLFLCFFFWFVERKEKPSFFLLCGAEKATIQWQTNGYVEFHWPMLETKNRFIVSFLGIASAQHCFRHNISIYKYK